MVIANMYGPIYKFINIAYMLKVLNTVYVRTVQEIKTRLYLLTSNSV